MIGLFGSILGFCINIVVWTLIQWAEPTYIPPGVSSPVPLTVKLEPQVVMSLLVFLVMLSLAAAILPARRAAGQNVVEALGHV